MTDDLDLPPHLRAILDAEYPRFSEAEMARRRAALETAMVENDLAHLVVWGAQRSGPAVPWLTGWPVTVEAVLVLTPGREMDLFIQYYNHVPQAEQVATGARVAWGNESTLATVLDALRARGAANARVGIVGRLSVAEHAALAEACGALVDANRLYGRLRLVKSPEEQNWLRIGAAVSDAGLASLCRRLRHGDTERDLAAHVEAGYLGLGAVNGIHFFGVTDMAAPDCGVPRQHPANRAVRNGDVLFTEITANFWEWGGQVLRTFSVGAEPTPLYRDLHAAAEAAFDAIVARLRPGVRPAELIAAAHAIEDAGFTTWDDLVHGFGGGYLPPIIGSASRDILAVPDLPLQAGMAVVVQPNVITRDAKAGVQTGEMLLITETGSEALHKAPRGLRRLDPS